MMGLKCHEDTRNQVNKLRGKRRNNVGLDVGVKESFAEDYKRSLIPIQ